MTTQHPRSPRSPANKLKDRTHEKLQKVKDLRRRRNSVQIEVDKSQEETAKILTVPNNLRAINRVARFWCVGCTNPPQSSFHIAAIKVTLLTVFASLSILTNESRLKGNITFAVQLAVLVVNTSTILCWRHARRNLLFDNLLRTRYRTIKMLEEAGRDDLNKIVEKDYLPSISKDRMYITPALVILLVAPASFLHIGAGDIIQGLMWLLLFAVLDNCDNMCCFHFEATCKMHSIQIQLFHDDLAMAFTDLAEVTTSEVKKVRSITANGSDESEQSIRRSTKSEIVETSIKTTEFFDENWVLKMSVAFVDICKTLNYTTEHMARFVSFDNVMFLVASGLIGLGMLVKEVNIEGIIVVMILLYFTISSMLHPIATNAELNKVRALSWDCYGELVSHSLLFKGSEDDIEATLDTSLKYQQIVNTAKHLLNIIQTSREGLKIGDIEYNKEIIIKILSISFSASIVVLKTGDLSPIIGLFSGGEDEVGMAQGNVTDAIMTRKGQS